MNTDPIRQGVSFAIIAAALFGATTPFVKMFAAGAGAFPTAMLLYAGASIASIRWFGARSTPEAPIRRPHVPRLFLVSVMGAVVAPVALAWGLRSTSASAASLLLNFEAVFTVLLGWRLFHEHLGKRLVVALAFMLGGGACLIFAQARGTSVRSR